MVLETTEEGRLFQSGIVLGKKEFFQGITIGKWSATAEAIRTTVVQITPLIRTTFMPISGVICKTVVRITQVLADSMTGV